MGRTLSYILFRAIRGRAKKWQALHEERKLKIQLVSEKVMLTKKQLQFYKREEAKASHFKEETQRSLEDEESSLMETMSYFLRRYDRMAKSAQRLQNTVSKKLTQEKTINVNMTKKQLINSKDLNKESSLLTGKIQDIRTKKRNVQEYLKERYEINDLKFSHLLQYFENLKTLQEDQLEGIKEILARNIRKNKLHFDNEVAAITAPTRPEVVNKLSPQHRALALDNTFYQKEINRLRCCETFTKLYNAFLKRDIGQFRSGPVDSLLIKDIIAPGLFQRVKCEPEDEVQLDIPVKIYVPF